MATPQMTSCSKVSRLIGVVWAALAFAMCQSACAFESPAYDRGCNEMSSRDWDGAIISFGEAIGFDMNNKDAYFRRGQCFFHMNNYQEAITDFSHLIQMAPRNAQAFLWRGTTYSKIGQNDQAVKDYLAAISIDPTLAKNYDQGNGQSADAAPGGLESKGGRQVRPARRVENPGAVENYKKAMDLYHQEGRFNEIGSGHNAASGERDSGGSASNSNSDIGTKGKYKTARAEVDTGSRKFDTLNPPTNRDVSTLSEQQKRVDEISDAIHQNPDDSDLYFKRAQEYRRMGNDDKALADFTDAIRINPMNWRAYLGRARIYNDHNEPDLRDIDIKHARNVNPKLPRRLKIVDDDQVPPKP